MNIRANQLGIGMVEVLVSLIILAIGVLGYTALQLRAVEAGDEALKRSQATILMRGLTESIRANSEGQSFYPKKIQAYSGMSALPTGVKSCLNTACNPEEMAAYDAYLVARTAFQNGMNMTMTLCPGANKATSNRQCLFVAWDETKFAGVDYSECISSSGIYINGAKCLMMEAY